ncbi:MAG: zinc ribbon domain-containing protein [Candidatus Odinarchaeota archaeon]|nr:zinc ribbon domain-containing protein [Candidatus Odinarchaeota archaeon]
MKFVSVKSIIISYVVMVIILFLVSQDILFSFINDIVAGNYLGSIASLFATLFDYRQGYELHTFILWSAGGIALGIFSKEVRKTIPTALITVIIAYILWKIPAILSFLVDEIISKGNLIYFAISLFICIFAGLVGTSLSPTKKAQSPVTVPPLVDLEPAEGVSKITPETIVATKKCPHCGSIISVSATYCPYCGKKTQ